MCKITPVFAFVFCFFLQNLYSQTIPINEVCAVNDSVLQDAEGDFPDWIELYNPHDAAVDLSGWQLQDENATWTFPAVQIAPYGYLLVFASDKNGMIADELHTNFKISGDGENLRLLDAQNQISDQIDLPPLAENQSYGRLDGAWAYFAQPTPNAANLTPPQSNVFPYRVTTETPPGFFSAPQNIRLLTDCDDCEIRYTLDSETPTAQDFIYDANAGIAATTGVSDSIAHIDATPHYDNAARGKQETAFVLRAAAFQNGSRVSPIFSGTWFIDAAGKRMTSALPVVSLISDYDAYFGYERGIYAPGAAENYYGRGEEWERETHVEFFDGEGNLQLAQSCGIRLAGAHSRIEPQKTFRLYAREKYGDGSFSYPLWGGEYGDSFDRITLRSTTAASVIKSGFTDELAHRILDERIKTEYVQTKPAVLFLNGVYWGIISLREHNGRHFLGRQYDIDDDEIIKQGKGEARNNTSVAFVRLREYLQNTDPQSEAFIDDLSDIFAWEGYIDYLAINLLIANWDWPDNNTEYWSAPVLDDRLHFLLNDFDAGFIHYNNERMDIFFDTSIRNLDRQKWKWITEITELLFHNRQFRQHFQQRVNELQQTTFAPERTVSLLRGLVAELEPEIQAHIDRYDFVKDKETWYKVWERTELFLLRRPVFLADHIREKLGTPFTVSPNPTAGNTQITFAYPPDFLQSIEVCDLQGRLLISEKPDTENASAVFNLDLNNLQKGMYVLRVQDGGAIFVKKIVVE